MIGASEARQNEGSCGRKARAILPAFVRSDILLIKSINKTMESYINISSDGSYTGFFLLQGVIFTFGHIVRCAKWAYIYNYESCSIIIISEDIMPFLT